VVTLGAVALPLAPTLWPETSTGAMGSTPE
jgi:hypothetical protein